MSEDRREEMLVASDLCEQNGFFEAAKMLRRLAEPGVFLAAWPSYPSYSNDRLPTIFADVKQIQP